MRNSYIAPKAVATATSATTSPTTTTTISYSGYRPAATPVISLRPTAAVCDGLHAASRTCWLLSLRATTIRTADPRITPVFRLKFHK